MIIIGSQAMKHFGLTERICSDWDIVGTQEEFDLFKESCDDLKVDEKLSATKYHIETKEGIHFEWDIATEGSTNEELIDIVERFGLHDGQYVNPDVQLTIKLSHRYRRNFKHFKKTLDDIKVLRESGYSVPHEMKEWLKFREKETYNTSRPILKQSKKDFFNTEGVTYKYDHDTLHLAVKRFDVPCYEYFKDDLAEVFCSREKFFEQDEQIKLGSVVEESLVLALERCLIPFEFRTHPDKAFLMALEKVCTSIASGFWREYAYDHYYDAIELYKSEYKCYITKFMDGLHNGTIKLHKGDN